MSSLKAYEAVARHGSFKNAAYELCVTPGALSQQVKKLECDLGFPVFIREHQGLRLTHQGQELKQTLCSVFAELSDTINKIQQQSDIAPLRVACGTPVAAKWLAPRLPKFMENYANIKVDIVAERELVSYQKQKIDIGIRLSSDEDESLDRVWLHEESAVLVCSPDYARKVNLQCPGDLRAATLLADDGLTYCRGLPIWHKWCEEAHVNPSDIRNVVHFGYSPEQALDASIAGCGVMVASKTLASLDLEAGRLIVPFGPEVSTHMRYQIVTQKDHSPREDIRVFKTWLLGELKPYSGKVSVRLAFGNDMSANEECREASLAN